MGAAVLFTGHVRVEGLGLSASGLLAYKFLGFAGFDELPLGWFQGFARF